MTLREQALQLRAQGMTVAEIRAVLGIGQQHAADLVRGVPRGASEPVQEAPRVQGTMVDGVLVLPYIEPEQRAWTARPVGRKWLDGGCYMRGRG